MTQVSSKQSARCLLVVAWLTLATLQMEAVRSPGTSMNLYQTVGRNIPEATTFMDGIIDAHCYNSNLSLVCQKFYYVKY
jgi:hypothetical protein